MVPSAHRGDCAYPLLVSRDVARSGRLFIEVLGGEAVLEGELSIVALANVMRRTPVTRVRELRWTPPQFSTCSSMESMRASNLSCSTCASMESMRASNLRIRARRCQTTSHSAAVAIQRVTRAALMLRPEVPTSAGSSSSPVVALLRGGVPSPGPGGFPSLHPDGRRTL
jgi:hypothetical protein